MRVILFGGTGQVGAALQRCEPFADELVVAARSDCDLAEADSLRRLIRTVRPTAIVNAAAYTAVDRAESDRERCFAVNAAAPAVIAEEAARLGAKFIHYSTDYVFDGKNPNPYVEEDATAPANVYGASKLAGEQGVTEAGGEFLLLRTSWVYSNHGANFLKTMLRLGAERAELRVVDDQRGAPTSADAIAQATARILREVRERAWHSGVYHMTAGGATTWFGFAQAIFACAPGPAPVLVPISTGDYPTPATRPANSVLSNVKFLSSYGFRLPEWQDQLKAVMTSGNRED